MKKLISMFVVVVLCMSALMGCGKKGSDTSTGDSYADSVAILNAIWEQTDEKFPAFGGSIEEAVADAPGNLLLTDKDTMTYTLLIPESVQGHITDAATLMHMMNANTFTGVALKLDGMKVDDAASQIKDAFMNNQFVCGIPDKIVIVTVGNYVVYAYGATDIVDDFKTIASGLDGANVVVDQAY